MVSRPKKLCAAAVFVVSCLLCYNIILRTLFRDFLPLCNGRGGQCEEVNTSEREMLVCVNTLTSPRIEVRGDFCTVYNYARARREFRGNASVTFTTHSDLTFLDNLEPLLQRWRGPVSLALHAPGTDLALTVSAVRYARECLSPLVTDYVTFHIYYGAEFSPEEFPKETELPPNCSAPAPWLNVSRQDLFKSRNGILYPVNVGRNIARETALTHYVLACDIELYPSPGLIEDFLAMVQRRDDVLLSTKPKVFPLAIFEVEQGMSVPRKKSELVKMLKNDSAIIFHQKLCLICHKIPKIGKWLQAPESPRPRVFHVAQRKGPYWHWEPIFIGTHEDPPYDESLSWEGEYDKMIQAYTMCVLDYEFMILDNAFLVHKPGIKRSRFKNSEAISRNLMLVRNRTFEVDNKYGRRNGCKL